MLAWLQANIGTLIVALVLLVIVALIVFRLLRNKQRGKSTCGCGCEHCAMQGSCHSQKKT